MESNIELQKQANKREILLEFFRECYIGGLNWVICINLSVKVFQKRMVKGLHAVEYSETPQLYGVPGGICGVSQ